jgi:hypothetical protein
LIFKLDFCFDEAICDTGLVEGQENVTTPADQLCPTVELTERPTLGLH